MIKIFQYILVSALILCSYQNMNSQESKKENDSLKKATKELPLEPERKINFKTNEGTWISVDIHPNGKEILFDLMGDIYKMPIGGGKAERLTKGMPYDVHPRYNPDGKSILYISDKSGSENIWTFNLETKKDKQITKDKDKHHFSADWSPDGDYIVGTSGRRNTKAFLYHKDGGSGAQLIKEPKNIKLIDPAFNSKGTHIYFSSRTNAWNYNAKFPQYQIMSFDREDGTTAKITSRYGSAFTPTFSSDGNWMVYGSRFEAETGLVLRNLNNGDERWLAYPVQRDEQESIAPLGVLPAMAFTPDNKNLIASYGGKIYSISLETNNATEIPFEIDVDLDLGPEVFFKYPISDEPEALVTQIRDAVPSPDGKKLAFTALNRLYIMDLPDGKPKRVTKNNFTEAHPSWSPNGESIVFSTWKPKGGHLYIANSSKTGAKQITTDSGVYTFPVWSYKSNKIAFLKGSAQTYKDAVDPFSPGVYDEIAWISPQGGAITVIDKAKSRYNPHFTKNDDRIYLNHGKKGLISIRWDGTDQKEHLKLTGITTYGSSDVYGGKHEHAALPTSDEAWREVSKASTPDEIKISPNGIHALAKINNDIYSVIIPKIGKTPTISLAKPESAAFPAQKLTIMGGEFPFWADNSENIHWSLGRSHFVYNLEKGKAFSDSLKLAKEKEKKLKETEKKKDSTAKKDDKKKKTPKFKAQEFVVEVSYKRDTPKGTILLEGARIITMNGDEIIEKGDILIENNRIKSIGESGTLTVPNKAKRMNVSGKTITPGFVDTHAHMWPHWNLHKNQVWIYSANLAYGVTTTRDPQTATTDVLTYSDMVDAGMIHGPRVYSTGPGLGFWAYKIQSLEHAKEVLKQYSDYYNTKTIKMYLAGNRQQRQWIIMACKELKLMPTTEGGLEFKSNMVNMIDGYPGHEHSFPIYPIYKDVIQTVAESKMAVTPTLLVAYGGPWGENYFYSRENPYHDKKLQYFTPYEELAAKSRRRPGWFMDEEHVFQKHAEFMKDLIEADGIGGIGSHGQLQGLGFHWELWAVASGGMKNLDALKIATIKGAEAIGLDEELGSIEIGKLADLLILDKNPIENLRNTNSLTHVIKNGVVYDANNLNEVLPIKKEAEVFHWQTIKPANLPGIKNKIFVQH